MNALSNEWPEVVTEIETEPQRFRLPEPLSWSELRKPVDYTNNLLGDRFLERSQGLILFGPSGCGKSVAAIQACAEWAAGLNGLHIKPAKPLKIVIIQTEDSIDDLRESVAGISDPLLPAQSELMEQNLVFIPQAVGGSCGKLEVSLTDAAETHKPDMIMVNPLLAFCDGDPTRELGAMLYKSIDPIIKRFHIGFVGVHHTPKTNNRDTSGYGVHDWQYGAAGDARIANWPRAMIQIEPVADDIYRFRAAKRGHRSGWTWDLKPTNERYFRHHKPIRWVDASPEDAKEAKEKDSYKRLLEVLPMKHEEPFSRDRVRDLAKSKFEVGINKADSWLKLVLEDGLAEEVKKGRNVFFRRAQEETGYV